MSWEAIAAYLALFLSIFNSFYMFYVQPKTSMLEKWKDKFRVCLNQYRDEAVNIWLEQAENNDKNNYKILILLNYYTNLRNIENQIKLIYPNMVNEFSKYLIDIKLLAEDDSNNKPIGNKAKALNDKIEELNNFINKFKSNNCKIIG